MALQKQQWAMKDSPKGMPVAEPTNKWVVRDSNPRPPACKAGALNQLS